MQTGRIVRYTMAALAGLFSVFLCLLGLAMCITIVGIIPGIALLLAGGGAGVMALVIARIGIDAKPEAEIYG